MVPIIIALEVSLSWQFSNPQIEYIFCHHLTVGTHLLKVLELCVVIEHIRAAMAVLAIHSPSASSWSLLVTFMVPPIVPFLFR